MSVATLKGTFDSFTMSDVLRLVAASGETGLLRVDSRGIGGRIFFVDGWICYATTRSDDKLISDLARMEQISEEERDAIERRAVQLEDVLSSREAVLDIFFGHQVSEVLVRLLAMNEGSYSFGGGVMMKHQTGYRVGVEEALESAAVRAAEWAEIRKVVPEVETPFRMAPAIEEKVTIDEKRWAILAALAHAGTAREVAVALKIFEFDAARKLAELATAGLVVVGEPTVEVAVQGWENEAAGSQDETTDEAEVEEPEASREDTSHEEPETTPENAETSCGEPDLTSEEAAELLGSFIALTDRAELPTVGAAEVEGEVVEEEDVDLAKRWRKLRKDRRSGGD